MISSYVGENAEFERQYLSGELEVELTPQVIELAYIHPGLNANEIQIPCDRHHKVSPLEKSHQNTHKSVKCEVM